MYTVSGHFYSRYLMKVNLLVLWSCDLWLDLTVSIQSEDLYNL